MIFVGLSALLLLVVATNGQSRCRLDDSCAPGLTTVELDICAFTDEDLDDLGACFDNVGRGNIEYLNLRRNDLVNIPVGFFDGFDALTGLNLDFNELIPQAGTFRGLTALDSLILIRNGLDSLPSGFFEGMDSLRRLDLFRNYMEFAAGDFIGATSLEELNLRETISGNLSSGVFEGLDSLLSLTMTENGLTTLPAGAFDGLPNLQILRLSRNRLTALPDGIFGELANLQELHVTENSFTTWTAGILNRLTSLTTLRLNDMPLITLEAGTFDGTPSLENLDLSSNFESTLPAGVFNVIAGSLIKLDLSGNSLSTFPAGNLDDFLSLQALNISSNSLILQPGFLQGATSLEYLRILGSRDALASDLFEGLTSLRALDISGNDIVLPTGVFDDLTSLTSLTFSGNVLALPIGVFDKLASLTALSLNVDLTTLEAGTFDGTPALEFLSLYGNDLSALSPGVFVGLPSLTSLLLSGNDLSILSNSVFDGLASLTSLSMSGEGSTLPTGILDGLASLTSLSLSFSSLTTLEEGTFEGTPSLEILDLEFNELTTVPAKVFDGLASLQELDLSFNQLTTVTANGFDGLVSLQQLSINSNDLTTLPTDAFHDLVSLLELSLDSNDLSTLPAGLFDGLDSLQELGLERNRNLQCLPATNADNVELPVEFDEDMTCACPTEPVCDQDGVACECQSGINGYSCVGSSSEPTRAFSCPFSDECTSDEQCADDEVCCPASQTCEPLLGGTMSACGDPHMTGFRGQKFDFTGEDGGWYALISSLPSFHINMRVTAPVPDLPEITYITGISLMAIGSDGIEHSIAISVKNPHSLESSCPSGMSSCLAEGALNVAIDGDNVLATPGTATEASGVEVSAVNLPGACRSFGFEKYWERKMLEQVRVGQAQLFESKSMAEFVAEAPPAPASQAMSEWILGDPTATNMMECAAYVAESMHTDGGVFAHQSEHASFKISTPSATVRVSHGRLHQVAMRDPSGQFDLPDHLTWQMNLAVDINEISRLTTGVLGETFVPTVDVNGNAIMNGMTAIRGTPESYRVAGPFDVAFAGSTKQV